MLLLMYITVQAEALVLGYSPGETASVKPGTTKAKDPIDHRSLCVNTAI